MNTMQWHLFKQQQIGYTEQKYCFLFFMHGNEFGLLTPRAKTYKREGLNKVRGGAKRHPRVNDQDPKIQQTIEYENNNKDIIF